MLDVPSQEQRDGGYAWYGKGNPVCACVCFQMGMITCFYADENLAVGSTNTA